MAARLIQVRPASQFLYRRPQTAGGARWPLCGGSARVVKGLGGVDKIRQGDKLVKGPPAGGRRAGEASPERAEPQGRHPACWSTSLDPSGRPCFTPRPAPGPPCRCARSREIRKLSENLLQRPTTWLDPHHLKDRAYWRRRMHIGAAHCHQFEDCRSVARRRWPRPSPNHQVPAPPKESW